MGSHHLDYGVRRRKPSTGWHTYLRLVVDRRRDGRCRTRRLSNCAEYKQPQHHKVKQHIQARRRSADLHPDCPLRFVREWFHAGKLEDEVESAGEVIESASPHASAPDQPHGNEVEVMRPRFAVSGADVES